MQSSVMNYAYDIEVYPNVHTFSCECIENGDRWYYEISERCNNLTSLTTFLFALRDSRANMVGYNNFEYDWLVINYILENYLAWLNLDADAVTALIYAFSKSIFNATKNQKFKMIKWQPLIRQIDLIQIHALNTLDPKTGQGRYTSLKMLEFNMRNVTVQDLPFKPGTILTVDQIPVLAHYNMEGDVAATVQFYHHTTELIKARDELSERFDKDFTNYSDPKIGEEYFKMYLEEFTPGITFYYDQFNKRQKRQTPRPVINLNDAVFPYIKFKQPEFQRITDYFKSQSITETKGVFNNLEAVIDGFKFVFGLGGIHGSVSSQSVHSDDDYVIRDIDVKSFYPNIAIANRVYPAHLGESFCDVYQDVYNQRKTYAKKTTMNNTLKLAMNAVYGKSNSKFSCFYDPLYTMTITINGQLLLCLLAERLMEIPGLIMIQANTDGVTVRVPRAVSFMVDAACRHWETFTALELEDVNYKSMFIRDVNSYIGVFEDGECKQIGAYETKSPKDQTPLGWHKDHSAMIVPKAANAVLVDGADLAEYITSPDRDIMDFMLRTKTPRASQLMWDGEEQQHVTRYFIAHSGGTLTKVSPPTLPEYEGWYKKKPGVSDTDYFAWFNAWGNVHNPDLHTKNESIHQTRYEGINVGWKTEICNDVRFMNASNLNHAFYIKEASKLIEGLI